jgi:nickel transport protein
VQPSEDADAEASGEDRAIVAPEASADLVEAAVQRQVAPLLERIEMMDDRLRFTDVMSGIFLIIGLAGIGLWARGRRR